MSNDPKLYDSKQLELVGGEIVETDGQRLCGKGKAKQPGAQVQKRIVS